MGGTLKNKEYETELARMQAEMLDLQADVLDLYETKPVLLFFGGLRGLDPGIDTTFRFNRVV